MARPKTRRATGDQSTAKSIGRPGRMSRQRAGEASDKKSSASPFSAGPADGSSITLLLPSDPHLERVAVDTAVSLARQLLFPHEKVEVVKTAVGEAYLNAVEHGNGGGAETDIEITFRVEKGQLTVLVRDSGPGFDPHQLPTPCLEDKLAGRSETRGWGLFLMRALVDELSVHRPPNGGSILTLVVKP